MLSGGGSAPTTATVETGQNVSMDTSRQQMKASLLFLFYMVLTLFMETAKWNNDFSTPDWLVPQEMQSLLKRLEESQDGNKSYGL